MTSDVVTLPRSGVAMVVTMAVNHRLPWFAQIVLELALTKFAVRTLGCKHRASSSPLEHVPYRAELQILVEN